MKTAYLFSGQGSQYVGMTRDLADAYAQASDMLNKANEILGYDLRSIMFDGPEEVLRETRYTQPALFLHEAILCNVGQLHSKLGAVAGHSLGEYSALFASGVLSFEDALQLVQLRANLMFEAGQATPGTMVAIVGLDDAVVDQICAEISQDQNGVVVPANFNSPGQVVVSGSKDLLLASMATFKNRGAKLVKELQVSGAFHSPLLAPAKSGLQHKIMETAFNDASVPVYVNVSAEPLLNSNQLRSAAIEQLTSPVRWTQTMANMWSAGLTSFCEVGPGKVLQGLVKRTLPEASVYGVDTAADIQRLLQENAE